MCSYFSCQYWALLSRLYQDNRVIRCVQVWQMLVFQSVAFLYINSENPLVWQDSSNCSPFGIAAKVKNPNHHITSFVLFEVFSATAMQPIQ
uniref:Uncharacterized protein n=1 Tax=Arundo donax TaxID=35708 RepID=A0A0A9HKI5_ARUDO